MNRKFLLLLAITILILWDAAQWCVFAQIPSSERTALIDLYNSTDGDNWDNNDGWKTSPLDSDGFAMPGTEGSWYGVAVNSNSVREIRYNANNLVGPIPPSIEDLINLQRLELDPERIESIPPEFGNLVNLEVLKLGSYLLTTLPVEFGNLPNLTDLHIWYSQLQTLSPEIGNLISITYINFNYNELKTLPPEIGNLINLIDFDLSHNHLQSIPPEIANLLNLRTLDMKGNNLTTLPLEIKNLSNLEIFNVRFNKICKLDTDIIIFLRLFDSNWSDLQMCLNDEDNGSIGCFIDMLTNH